MSTTRKKLTPAERVDIYFVLVTASVTSKQTMNDMREKYGDTDLQYTLALKDYEAAQKALDIFGASLGFTS